MCSWPCCGASQLERMGREFGLLYCTERVITSDLQKSRHLQKNRVIEQHNRRTKRKLKSHQAQKRRFAPFLGQEVQLQVSLPRLCRSVTRLFLQMTRLLQVTKITKCFCSCPTSNRYHSISFVKTDALEGFPSSRTAVLTDFLKN